jgi:hypothetical protein
MPTLSTGVYTVRSFMGAIHAVLYHCIPANQSLREFILLAKFLQPLIQRYGPTLDSRPKINLLACGSVDTVSHTPRSHAIMAVGAWGRNRLNDLIIQDRRENLPILEELQTCDLPWKVGNCAEDETFAHHKCLRESISPADQHSETIVVSLTIDLMDVESLGPCRQCGDLFRKLREQLRQQSPCYIWSIAPLKGAPADPIIARL